MYPARPDRLSAAKPIKIYGSTQRLFEALSVISLPRAVIRGSYMIAESIEQGRSLEKTDPENRSEIHLPPIVIIEARALIRECLAISLQLRLTYPVLTYPKLESWKQDQAGSSVGVMILGRQEMQADSNLSKIIQELCEIAGATPVIVFSDEQDAGHIINVFRYGAKGYIPSATPLEIAAGAIRLVMAGGTFIPSNVVVAEARHDVGSEIDCSHTATRFTGREDEVVRAMLTGKQNKLIGYELGITESSVKVHIRNIMRKLGVRNRTEAVIKISEIIRESRLS
jgi:DNA-binding NarL/FixJ family response regulator